MEQNIVTGGTRSTSTPMLKFLMNKALLEPASEARHIEHCPNAELLSNSTATIAAITSTAPFVRKPARIKVPRPPAAGSL
jgi:hypothetical protein